MSEPTVGDVAKFLRENPGPHRIGEYTVEHRGSFDRQDWKAGNEEIEP